MITDHIVETTSCGNTVTKDDMIGEVPINSTLQSVGRVVPFWSNYEHDMYLYMPSPTYKTHRGYPRLHPRVTPNRYVSPSAKYECTRIPPYTECIIP